LDREILAFFILGFSRKNIFSGNLSHFYLFADSFCGAADSGDFIISVAKGGFTFDFLSSR
jgi:hypothetical protein